MFYRKFNLLIQDVIIVGAGGTGSRVIQPLVQELKLLLLCNLYYCLRFAIFKTLQTPRKTFAREKEVIGKPTQVTNHSCGKKR